MSTLVVGCSHRHLVTSTPEIVVQHAVIATSKTVRVEVVDILPEKKLYSENHFRLKDVGE